MSPRQLLKCQLTCTEATERHPQSLNKCRTEESQAVGQGLSVGLAWRALISGKADKCPDALEMETGVATCTFSPSKDALIPTTAWELCTGPDPCA